MKKKKATQKQNKNIPTLISLKPCEGENAFNLCHRFKKSSETNFHLLLVCLLKGTETFEKL